MERPQRGFLEMPLCFTGMGIFRVWTETVYANSLISFPAQTATGFGYAAFNLIAAIALIAAALGARRISPLYGKAWPTAVAGIGLVSSTCLNFYSIANPDCAALVGAPAAVLGGVGIAVIILLWSELFGCLNPLRVGLYFSGGLVTGSLVLWLFKGLALPWLWVCTCLVPMVSLAFLRRAYRLLPDSERPHAAWGSFSFPWKPIAIVALYSFAYGLCEYVFDGTLGIHSGLGAVFAGVVVYAGICLKRGSFRYSTACKLALPLIILSLFPFSELGPLGSEFSGFCALGSYSLCLIVIMVILSNLTYRYGANALWLFGFERAARLLSVQVGISTRGLFDQMQPSPALDAALAAIVAASVIAATALFLSEKQLSSPWGAVLKNPYADERLAYSERNRLGTKCHELAGRFGLTQREEEIVLLLAQRKKPADIERELFVANSTVKTHVKHIYQKLDVHSRTELYQLLGIAAR